MTDREDNSRCSRITGRMVCECVSKKVSEAGAAHRQHTLIWFSVTSFGWESLAIAGLDGGKARVTYQVADNDLAISLDGWAGWSLDGILWAARSLCDTADWGSWGGWLASSACAATAAATASSSTSGTGVGHDLVQRLVDLGRHIDLSWSDCLW